MAEVKVFYDREGKTLTVWFTDRSQEYVCSFLCKNLQDGRLSRTRNGFNPR
jgi:hypothetical protein